MTIKWITLRDNVDIPIIHKQEIMSNNVKNKISEQSVKNEKIED